MKYTEQQLMDMPMKFLRNLDIETGEDEKLVQRVLNTRLKDMPVENPVVFPSSVTDNMTIEKERELQARIDARNSRMKAQLKTDEEIPQIDEVESQPLPDPTEEPKETEPTTEVDVVKDRFCELCDSKGVRHKKECSLYVPARGPGSKSFVHQKNYQ